LLSANTLFQISEPAGNQQGKKRTSGRAVGIDLGTTHSLVALAPDGAAPYALGLRGEQGRTLLPSVVSYVHDEVVVGSSAAAEASQHPDKVLVSAKRFVGRGREDIKFAHPYRLSDEEGLIRFELEERRVTPIEASAEILRVLKREAEEELGHEVEGAVITVPAYFDDAQRQATRDAGRIAGLEVYRLVAEPTAAALAYGLDRGEEGIFAVYDLGGGTFDISVLRLRAGVFQVLATGGDSALGGDDFDRALADEFLDRAGVSDASAQQIRGTQQAARRVKEALSSAERVPVEIPSIGWACESFTREELEGCIAKLVKRTIRACRNTLKDAALAPVELAGVILVGGSTRVPAVRSAVEAFFGRAPLSDLDPDRVVAYGAAVTADLLSGSEREGVTLLDVVPLSLGLETMGGVIEKVIPRNATIPIAAKQVFTNYSEKQTAMSIHVVQGERELAVDCRSLARFDLRGMPQLPPGLARVEVTFQLDADALLTVTATELMTGTKQRVEVKATYGLDAEDVDRLVMESLDHAGEDFAARDLAEARTEMGRVILALRGAYDELGHIDTLLPADEKPALIEALGQAEALMAVPVDAADRANAETINKARKRLEAASEGFARRRMERALRAGMEGHSLAEIESALAAEDELEKRRAPHAPELIEK
jgi:molecular chaperone HscA